MAMASDGGSEKLAATSQQKKRIKKKMKTHRYDNCRPLYPSCPKKNGGDVDAANGLAYGGHKKAMRVGSVRRASSGRESG